MIAARDWITEKPETLKRRIPRIRLMDRREFDYDRKRPYITQCPSFAVWDHGYETFLMVIPEGYKFDIASIPRFLWPIVSPQDLGRTGPLFHDWMIDNVGCVDVYKWNDATRCWVLMPGAKRWSRRDTDRFFWRMMREDMEDWATANGFKGWAQKTKRKLVRRWSFKAVRAWVLGSNSEWAV